LALRDWLVDGVTGSGWVTHPDTRQHDHHTEPGLRPALPPAFIDYFRLSWVHQVTDHLPSTKMASLVPVQPRSTTIQLRSSNISGIWARVTRRERPDHRPGRKSRRSGRESAASPTAGDFDAEWFILGEAQDAEDARRAALAKLAELRVTV